MVVPAGSGAASMVVPSTTRLPPPQGSMTRWSTAARTLASNRSSRACLAPARPSSVPGAPTIHSIGAGSQTARAAVQVEKATAKLPRQTRAPGPYRGSEGAPAECSRALPAHPGTSRAGLRRHGQVGGGSRAGGGVHTLPDTAARFWRTFLGARANLEVAVDGDAHDAVPLGDLVKDVHARRVHILAIWGWRRVLVARAAKQAGGGGGVGG